MHCFIIHSAKASDSCKLHTILINFLICSTLFYTQPYNFPLPAHQSPPTSHLSPVTFRLRLQSFRFDDNWRHLWAIANKCGAAIIFDDICIALADDTS